jgi:hypothetical protein
MGAEISWGSSSLASAATYLSDSVTFDRSGALTVGLARCAGSEEHAARRKHTGAHESRIQLFCR